MQTHSWQRLTISLLSVALLPAQILSGAPLYWFALSYIIYYFIAIASTVGYHRLFNHNSFKCNKIWHWIFGVIGCIGLNSSPFHWSIVHSGHHRYSDTINDPYDSSWKFFFRVKDRTLKVFRNDMRLARIPMHQLFMAFVYNKHYVCYTCVYNFRDHGTCVSVYYPCGDVYYRGRHTHN